MTAQPNPSPANAPSEPAFPFDDTGAKAIATVIFVFLFLLLFDIPTAVSDQKRVEIEECVQAGHSAASCTIVASQPWTRRRVAPKVDGSTR
jgi:hypothetical protein